MASYGRRTRAPSRPRSIDDDDDTRSFSPPPPPPPPNNDGRDRGRASGSRKRKSRHRGYSVSRDKPARKANVTLILAVFHSSRNHSWRTTPITFDRFRATDQSLWEDIRYAYRHQLQKEWRRVFLFTRLKHIVPIEVGVAEFFHVSFGNATATNNAGGSYSLRIMMFPSRRIPKISRTRTRSCMLTTIPNG